MLAWFGHSRCAESDAAPRTHRSGRRGTGAKPIAPPAFEACEPRLLLSGTISLDFQVGSTHPLPGCISAMPYLPYADHYGNGLEFGRISGSWKSWEIEVPNGTYAVDFRLQYDSQHDVIAMEGATVAEVPGTHGRYAASVTVADGRLTIQKVGGTDWYFSRLDITGDFGQLPPFLMSVAADTGDVFSNDEVEFAATVLDFDTPADQLNYDWRVDGVTRGTAAGFASCFAGGTREVTLTVSDGVGSHDKGVTFNVQTSPAAAGESRYLIVAADQLYESILPLAEWKRLKGFQTEVWTLSRITAEYDLEFAQDEGGYWFDEAGPNLKTFVDARFRAAGAPLGYLLLVGDAYDVPSGFSSGYASDNVLACLDGEWDFLPDFAVGRLTTSTAAETAAVVEKILTYDRNPDAGDWYQGALIAAQFEDDGNGQAMGPFAETALAAGTFLADALQQDGEQDMRYAIVAPERASYYYRDGTLIPQSLADDAFVDALAGTQRVRDALNSGVGLAIHRDHGNVVRWGEPNFSRTDANALANGIMTPVVWSINCETGMFNADNECLAEAFLEKAGGGAVGVVAATGLSYSFWNDAMVFGMLDAMWDGFDEAFSTAADSLYATYIGSMRPAEALAAAKYYMSRFAPDDTYTAYTADLFHWFGDPEMMLRTAAPVEYDVDILDGATPLSSFAVNRRYSDFTVQVGAAPGARVCISRAEAAMDDYSNYWVAMTDEDGRAHFPGITSLRAGVYNIVVSGHNGRPSEGTIVVDVDADNALDCRDVLAYYGNVGDGGFDLDGDADADYADVQYIVETLFGCAPGDGNLDGSVTQGDYTAWADNYGKGPADWTLWADFNYSGTVTHADYTLWADNFGKTPPDLLAGNQASLPPVATLAINDSSLPPADTLPNAAEDMTAMALKLAPAAAAPAPSEATITDLPAAAATQDLSSADQSLSSPRRKRSEDRRSAAVARRSAAAEARKLARLNNAASRRALAQTARHRDIRPT